MYRDCPAELRMTRMILSEGYMDEESYPCKVITYHSEEECIYLLTGKTEVTTFSLDGIYECRIKAKDEIVTCSGVIKERYWSKLGKVVVFQIKNGFYKNPLN